METMEEQGQTGAAGSETRLILGPGNPGARYRTTRHNLGFRVVEELSRRWRVVLDQEDCRSRVGRGGPADLAMPLTFMNRSGYAARCLVSRYHYRPENILVVYDEVHLPLGRLRLRPRGSPGGHRGMESVIESLRTSDIPRLRLGIAPETGGGNDLAEFVLTPFTSEEEEAVAEEVARAAEACEAWIERGAEETMNQFNR